jgi:CHAD domain-containing protein
MPKNYKWEIKNLSAGKSLKSSGRMALQQRLKSLEASIKKYFDEETVENLHEIRIALRRLRYGMELFISCFDEKKFVAFYQLVEQLQDLTGAKRDLDVLAENIKNIYNDGKDSEAKRMLKKVGVKSNELHESLRLELMKFVHSKELKEFEKLL